MGSSVPEDMRIAMFLALSGDNTHPTYGHFIGLLQRLITKPNCDRGNRRILNEYVEKIWNNVSNWDRRREMGKCAIALAASNERRGAPVVNVQRDKTRQRNTRKRYKWH